MVKKQAKKIARAVIKDMSVEKRKKKGPMAPRTTISGVSGLTRELACSVLSPFDCSACIPDGRTNTGCFSIKNTGQLSTGTGTCCGIAVDPNAYHVSYLDSGSTLSAPNLPGGSTWLSNQYSVLTAQYSTYRIVSCGLRLTYAGNTQTDQGTIAVGQLASNKAPSSLNTLNLSSFTQALSDYRIIPLRNGCEIIWRPQEMTDMATYQAFGAVNGTLSSTSSTPILVAWIYGASTGSIIANYEFIINLEGQFLNLGFIPGGVDSAVKGKQTAEVGWFERMKNIVDKVTPIVPLVGSALTGLTGNPLFSQLGALANGIRYPSVSSKPSRLRF